VLISWLYVVMELVGDYSENPFEGLSNDVPMLALSRSIEIDLLQQLGEAEVPAPIQPVQHVLL
jgi:putative membrane protein